MKTDRDQDKAIAEKLRAEAESLAARESIFWETDHPNPARMELVDWRSFAPPTTAEIVEGQRCNLKQAQIMFDRAVRNCGTTDYFAERASRGVRPELCALLGKAVRAQIKQDYQRAHAELDHWCHELDWWQARAAAEKHAGTPVCNPKPEVSDDELPF